MDLAKRILKITRDTGGVAVFISVPKPQTGFIVVYGTEVYENSTPDLDIKLRLFLINNLNYNLNGAHGVACYRRSGKTVMGLFQTFSTQLDAVQYAVVNRLPYVYNLETNTSINVGNYEPNLPGDGVVEV